MRPSSKRVPFLISFHILSVIFNSFTNASVHSVVSCLWSQLYILFHPICTKLCSLHYRRSRPISPQLRDQGMRTLVDRAFFAGNTVFGFGKKVRGMWVKKIMSDPKNSLLGVQVFCPPECALGRSRFYVFTCVMNLHCSTQNARM